MICPVCKSQMIVVEHQKIELDYCPQCYGVWFDSGEMGLLLESAKLEDPQLLIGNILKSPEARTAEKKRRCPICRENMKKVNAGDRPKILIDVCRRGDGLWFDGGEVAQLIKQELKKAPHEESHEQITEFLGDVFKARE